VVNLNDGIPDELVEFVTLEDLQTRGEFEILKVLFRLNKMDPNDAEDEARKLLDDDSKRSFVENNALFRATKYRPDHPALAGKTLEPLAEQPIPFSQLVEETLTRLKAEEPAEDAESVEGDDSSDSEQSQEDQAPADDQDAAEEDEAPTGTFVPDDQA